MTSYFGITREEMGNICQSTGCYQPRSIFWGREESSGHGVYSWLFKVGNSWNGKESGPIESGGTVDGICVNGWACETRGGAGIDGNMGRADGG